MRCPSFVLGWAKAGGRIDMGMIKHAVLFLSAFAMPSMAAQYETPANPADPAAQLAELIGLYDSVCLRAFPDDAAVARTVEAQGGTPMSAAEVRIYLHDDPGRGWNLTGRTGTFRITV